MYGQNLQQKLDERQDGFSITCLQKCVVEINFCLHLMHEYFLLFLDENEDDFLADLLLFDFVCLGIVANIIEVLRID